MTKNAFLNAWNFLWTCVGVIVVVFLVTLVFTLLLMTAELDAFLLLTLLFMGAMLGAMAYMSIKELILPHVKARSLIKQSKLLIDKEEPAIAVGNKDRMTADDVLVLTQRDTLRLSIDPLDAAMLDSTLHIIVELMQKGEWRPMSTIVSSIPPVNNTNHQHYIAHYHAFRKCLNRTASYLLDNIHTLYCTKHHRRFIQTDVHGVRLPVCRQCKKTSFGISVTNVALVIDQNATWKSKLVNGIFKLNLKLLEDLPDFNVVEIGHHTAEDIERFCIQIGNDSDMHRVPTYKKIAYRALPGISMSQKSIALLDKFFLPMTPNKQNRFSTISWM